MIYKGSRYEGNALYYDPLDEESYLAPLDREIKPHPSDFVYQFQSGDRLDLLARQFYGNAHFKWIIMLANSQFATEFDIEVGSVLNIPNPDRMSEL